MPVDRDGQSGTAKMAVEDGSTNVYADLRRPDADEMLVKAQLASRVGEVIKRRRLTQEAAVEITGLLRGQFRGVSEAKILACPTRLDRDVRIVVGPARRQARAGRIEVLSG